MRRLAIFLILISLSSPVFATFGAASQWDVQTTGADTHGGAFDSGVGSPGTDESKGSGTAVTITLASGTTGSSSPAITSTTHGPGNFVYIASGSGCTVGWYEILSQSAGVATFDRSMGSATNVCTGTLGGSLLTIQQANTEALAGNTINIQSGTYTLTASITFPVSTIAWIGYQTTHGDGGTCPLITTSTNSVVLLNTGSSNGGQDVFTNLCFSNTAATRASGIWQLSGHGTTQSWFFIGDVFNGFTTAIDDSDGTPDDVGYIWIVNSEIENSSVNGANINGDTLAVNIFGSLFSGNVQSFSWGSSSYALHVSYSMFVNTSGSLSLDLNGDNLYIDHCTFANNTSSSEVLSLSATNSLVSITNSVFYGNTGVAIHGSGADTLMAAFSAAGRNNAFGSNGTNYNGGWLGSPGDVTITANPFTNSSGGDYSLNSTAGGGAVLKGAGYPGVFIGGATTGHTDIGAAQSSGGGGNTYANYGSSY